MNAWNGINWHKKWSNFGQKWQNDAIFMPIYTIFRHHRREKMYRAKLQQCAILGPKFGGNWVKSLVLVPISKYLPQKWLKMTKLRHLTPSPNKKIYRAKLYQYGILGPKFGGDWVKPLVLVPISKYHPQSFSNPLKVKLKFTPTFFNFFWKWKVNKEN